MKVKNMLSSSGNKVANQFIVRSQSENKLIDYEVFQSYDTAIIKVSTIIDKPIDNRVVELDYKWNYSQTTSK